MSKNDAVRFIKKVSVHLRDRPAHKTSDMFHNMETVDYNLSNDDNMNLSNVETVQYDDSEI